MKRTKAKEKSDLELVDEAAELDLEIKKLTSKLEPLKDKIKDHAKNFKLAIVNGKKHKAIITESAVYSPILPSDAYDKLEDKHGADLGLKFFLDAVKIEMKSITKYLGKDDVDNMRSKISTQIKISFK